ncbi:unnamed protein product, partial [Musa hybrid cultivar]
EKVSTIRLPIVYLICASALVFVWWWWSPSLFSPSSSLPNGSSESGRVIESRARGASFFLSVLLALRFVRSGILRGRYRDLSSCVICLIPARKSPDIA